MGSLPCARAVNRVLSRRHGGVPWQQSYPGSNQTVWGVIVGAVGTMIVGFSWLGWTLGRHRRPDGAGTRQRGRGCRPHAGLRRELHAAAECHCEACGVSEDRFVETAASDRRRRLGDSARGQDAELRTGQCLRRCAREGQGVAAGGDRDPSRRRPGGASSRASSFWGARYARARSSPCWLGEGTTVRTRGRIPDGASRVDGETGHG